MKSLEKFSDVKILVIGDLMLDRYWWGKVTRISPEAPVPIVHLYKSTYTVGGAANVAANIAGLGAEAILVGLVGIDEDAKYFCESLKEANVSDEHLIYSDNRPTIVKTRVIAHSQQMVRIDQEEVKELDEVEQEAVFNKLLKVIDEVQVIILSDYAKGLLTDSLISKIIKLATEKKKIILVDPKGKDYQKYKGATLITPNMKEASEACKIDEKHSNWINEAARELLTKVSLEAVLITQGEEGMTLFTKDGNFQHFHASAREIFDVTGAGDTVIATLAVSLGACESLEKAAEVANIAAGLVVEQVGTTTIKYNDLLNYIKNN